MNHSKFSKLFSLVLALVLAFTFTVSVTAEEAENPDAKIEAAKAAMEAAEKALDAANNALADAETKLKEAKDKLADAEAALEAAGIDPDDLNNAESAAVKELKEQIAKLTADSTQAGKDLLAAQGQKRTDDAAVKAAQEAVDAKNGEITAKEGKITVVEGEIKNIDDEVALNNTKITNNTTAITNAQNELAGMEDTLADYQAGIDNADKAVEALEKQQAALETQQKELAALEDELTTQQNVLDGKKQTLADAEAAHKAQDATLQEKKKELEQAEKEQTAAQGALDAAESALKTAKEKTIPEAEKALKAAQEKVDSGTLSGIALWAAEKALKTAQQALEKAKNAIPGLETEVTEAQADLDAKKLATQAAQAAHDAEQAKLDEADAAITAAGKAITEQETVITNQQTAIREKQKLVDAELAQVKELLKADPEAQKKAAEEKYNEYKANYETKKDELEQKISDAETANGNLTAANEQLAADKTTKVTELETRKAELADLQTELTKLQDAKTAADNKAAETQAAIDKLNNETIPGLKAQLEELNEQLKELQAADNSSALVADYKAAKAAAEAAQTYYDAMLAAKGLAQVAYDEAYSLYQQLIGSTSCAHDKYEMTVFGNTFCLMKVAGVCTHNLGVCCGSLNTTTIRNNISSYVQNGDFEGLANEAKSVYNQVSNLVALYDELPESVKTRIEDTVRGLINAAADKAIDYIKDELKDAIASSVPAEQYDEVMAAIDKAAEAIKEIKENLGTGELTEAEIKNMIAQAAQQVLDKALNEIKNKVNESVDVEKLEEIKKLAEEAIAKIEALMDQVPSDGEMQAMIDRFKAEVEKLLNDARDELAAAAKEYLEQKLAEIKEKIDSAIANSNLDEIKQEIADAIAKFEEMIEELPNRDELKELIGEFKDDVAAAVKAAYEKYAAAAEAHIKEKLEEILNSDGVKYIEERIAQYKAEVEAYLANYHICEYTVDTVHEVINAKAQECLEDIKAYIKAQLEAAADVTAEEAKAELKKLAAAIAAALNVEIDWEEIDALVKETVEALLAKAEDHVENKIQVVRDYIDTLLEEAMIRNQVIVPGKEPTCTEPGLTEGIACKCGNYVYQEQEEIPATGHLNTEIHDAKNADCVSEGYTGDTWCLDCGEMIKEGEAIPANGHGKTELRGYEPATCTEDGYTGNTWCTVCKTVIRYGRPIPAKGHIPGAEATCTTAQYCKVCKEEIAPAKGHTPNIEAATCTEDKVCTVCEEVLEEAKGHTPGAEATCTTAQVCTVCGAELTPAKGHGETEVRDAKEAACTEEGYTGDTWCLVCESKIAEGEAIPAKGHGETEIRGAKEATYTEEGYTGDTWCLVCETMIQEGEVIAKLPMEYYNMSVCAEGLSFRDMTDLTKEWDMFTPIDLSVEGEKTFALIAGGHHVIGTVTVLVKNGELTVDYELVCRDIMVRSEFLSFLPSLSEVTTLDQKQLTAFEFGESISIADAFGADTKVLMYICNEVFYPVVDEHVTLFKADADYAALVEELKLIMD